MRIELITPAGSATRTGNRVTALRWAKLLRGLGHRVRVGVDYDGVPCDLMVALHARRSLPSMTRFKARQPDAPLVLALTGTDLYGDIHSDAQARAVLSVADRLVLLQPEGLKELPPALHPRCRVILQSVTAPRTRPAKFQRNFTVAVIGHIRAVKDPLLAARAARGLPAESRLRVVMAGAALDPDYEAATRAEARDNPRLRWVGSLTRGRALRLLGRSHALVLSSRSEGGANVISEALVLGVPVLATDIPGNVGLLGADYPGLFPVGDAEALRVLLHRAETNPKWLASLAAWGRHLAPQFTPQRERAAWAKLLAELSAGSSAGLGR